MRRPGTIRRLERQIERESIDHLQGRVERARERAREAIAKAARDPRSATSRAARKALEGRIVGIYDNLGREFDGWLEDMVASNGPTWAKEAQSAVMGGTGGKVPLMEFSRDRVRRYAEILHEGNTDNLAAVFTNRLSQRAIRDLRLTTTDVFRQASIEGWPANEVQKRLQDAWDRVAGNTTERRFIDRGGAEWTNSRYLQMLTRTTVQRASRDIYIDQLVEGGFELAQISTDSGDPCPICEAWEGLIVQVAGSGRGGGRYPTYQQSLDAGMWHPNCTHRLEYIDAKLEADEIDIQREESAPRSWDDPDAVLDYRNRIDVQRYQAKQMTAAEARREVIRDRMNERMHAGGFEDRFAAEIAAIPDKVLDEMDLSALPHARYLKTDEGAESFSRNSSRGGWLVLDREAGPDAFKRGFYSLQTKRGVEVPHPKKAKD